jgi:hypothetical protein
MNNDFESIAGAIELSNEDLMMIQGGSLWSWVKGAASDVGHAIGSAAKAVGKALSSNDGKKALGTIGSVLGIVAGIVALF